MKILKHGQRRKISISTNPELLTDAVPSVGWSPLPSHFPSLYMHNVWSLSISMYPLRTKL